MTYLDSQRPASRQSSTSHPPQRIEDVMQQNIDLTIYPGFQERRGKMYGKHPDQKHNF